jgi:hypothetical protein
MRRQQPVAFDRNRGIKQFDRIGHPDVFVGTLIASFLLEANV